MELLKEKQKHDLVFRAVLRVQRLSLFRNIDFLNTKLSETSAKSPTGGRGSIQCPQRNNYLTSIQSMPYTGLKVF